MLETGARTAAQVVCPWRMAWTMSVAVKVCSGDVNPDWLILCSLLQVCLAHAMGI
jgi:hypothetical protein